MNLKHTIRKVLLESEIPPSVRRRMRYNEEDIINYLKKFAIRTFQYDKKIDVIVSKACRNTAYEILDSTHTSVDDEIFNGLENRLTYYLKDKYGEQIKEFINSFFDSSGDKLGDVYIFWKHADRNGGNGFSESFETWNMLLRKYADWFPDLDWAEIKTKLDDNGKLLIKKPGDKNNVYNYYFSLIKK